MIKYRPNKGSFNESIKHTKIFNTLDEMFEHIESKWNHTKTMPLIQKEHLCITHSLGKDMRTGWKDYRYVYTNQIGDELYDVPQCVAVCSIE